MTPGGRGLEVLIVFTMFAGLTTVATALRVYTKIAITKQFGIPDALAVLAWVFFACYAALGATGVYHGIGQHAWDIHPSSELVNALKYWWLCEPFYVLANMAVKASIAIFLLRLIMEPIQRALIYVVIIVMELYSALFFFVVLLQCIPSDFFFTRFAGATQGYCLSTKILVNTAFAYSAISCLTDWTLSILPVVVVCKLTHLPKREKVLCAIILAMGAVASFATIARFPYISTMADTADFLYITTPVAVWCCAETGLAIAACSFATLRPLFRQCLGLSENPLAASYPTVSSRGIRLAKRQGLNDTGFTDATTAVDGADLEVIQLSVETKSSF